MGNIPLHATGRRKIATTLQRVDGTLLWALIHPGPMLQSSSRKDDAERTEDAECVADEEEEAAAASEEPYQADQPRTPAATPGIAGGEHGEQQVSAQGR